MPDRYKSRPPPRPSYEPERLRAVREAGLYGTPAEDRFDVIVRLARRSLGVTYAAVNVIGDASIYFKSVEGGPPGESFHDRNASYCTWALVPDAANLSAPPASIVISDSLEDPRTKDNPVAKDFRFYAAVPVRFLEQPIAVLCIGGPEPREITGEELDILRDLARLVEVELSRQRLSRTQVQLAAELDAAHERAAIDPLTRTWSRTAILEIGAREISRGAAAILMLDVDHFKAINDTFGHPAGDAVLRKVSDRIRGAIRGGDAAGRYAGDEFLCVLPTCDERDAMRVAERIRAAVAAHGVRHGDQDIVVTVTIGVCTLGGHAGTRTVDLLIKGADEALYNAKRSGRNCVAPRQVTPSLYMRAMKVEDAKKAAVPTKPAFEPYSGPEPDPEPHKS